MKENDQLPNSRLNQNLRAAFQALTDIALHPDNSEGDIKSIAESVLEKRVAKSTNPKLKPLRDKLTRICHVLLDEPASSVFYIQIQDKNDDITGSIDATKQKLIDLPEQLKASESELSTSEKSYLLAVTDGNDIEQDEIERCTNKCESRVSTLKMMIKSCHLSLELNSARSALLQKLLIDQQSKNKAILFKPLQNELADATNEYCRVLERIYGAALAVPNLDTRESSHLSNTRSEHPIIGNVLEQIINTAHNDKTIQAHRAAFDEESEAALTNNVDFEFSPK